MKTPHLAILAAAMMGGNCLSWPKLATPQESRAKGRYGVSQRIIRKNRRRSHAAGNKKAFKP